MSSHIREALTELERDVAGLQLATAATVRARGDARRRRQVGTVALGAAVLGAVALSPLYAGWPPSGGLAVGGPGSLASSAHASALSGATTECSAAPSDHTGTPGAANSRRIRVFLNTSSTPAQRATVESVLRNLNVVDSYTFEDRQTAWQRFVAQFCNARDLVAATKPESLPESFTVELHSPADYSTLDNSIEHLPGVAAVVRVPD